MLNNKKIIFLRSIHTTFGGAEVFLSRLTQALTQKNIAFEIWHSSAPKFLPSWIKAWWFNFETSFKKNWFKKNKNLFYFSLDRISSADIYRAGDGVHKAYLKTKNFSLNPLHISYLILEKLCFKNSQKIIANSQKTKQEIIKFYKINPEKIVIIPNGLLFSEIPINSLKNPEQALRIKDKIAQEFKINAQLPFILFVGSGFKRKGLGQFLKIIAQIKTPFHAFILGKEKNLNFYQKLAADLNISHQITFTGQRKDVADFYLASRLFIYPPAYEPFSNVILEAMAHGCVAFTNDHNGAAEILPPEFNLTQNPNSIFFINSLLENPVLLSKAQTLQCSIAQQYSIEKTADQTLDLILKNI